MSLSIPAEVNAAALTELLREKRARVIDVRSGAEFAGGHIPGADLIPVHEIASRVKEIPTETQVVCVCQSGQRSAKARDELLRLGVPATSLAGGMSVWEGAGLPVERDAKAPWSLERQVRIAAGSLALIGVVLGSTVHSAFFALSAFVGVGLIFAGITDWCGMGLLLARAPWNQRAAVTKNRRA